MCTEKLRRPKRWVPLACVLPRTSPPLRLRPLPLQVPHTLAAAAPHTLSSSNCHCARSQVAGQRAGQPQVPVSELLLHHSLRTDS